MASETGRELESESPHRMWVDAGVAGLAAGVLMGLLMHFVMGIMPIVGGLYGARAVPAGWVAHLFHAVLFGLVFAAIASAEELRDYAESPVTGVGLGVAWAAVLWLVAASVVMPVWMGAAGLGAPDVPRIRAMVGVAHAIYGVVLGGVFGYLRSR